MAVRIEREIYPEEEPREKTIAEKVVEWAQAPSLSSLLERKNKLNLIMSPQSEEIDSELSRIAEDIYAARICFVNHNNRFSERESVPFIDFFDLVTELDEKDPAFIESHSELVSFIVEQTTAKK